MRPVRRAHQKLGNGFLAHGIKYTATRTTAIDLGSRIEITVSTSFGIEHPLAERRLNVSRVVERNWSVQRAIPVQLVDNRFADAEDMGRCLRRRNLVHPCQERLTVLQYSMRLPSPRHR